ncbi:tetratricopeptide repeat protein [Allochromatium palmeri]|uniref:Uncharacterized protein n=1 Tax=Allochromatium palmeri TaxID=231048 RepID=A0A6N8EEN3_9GAMM|nr:tetratricopeptide repeat protein [Allochromatium palmeri]MTW22683.1 hypothetical protein [Allochromatium palmeri]
MPPASLFYQGGADRVPVSWNTLEAASMAPALIGRNLLPNGDFGGQGAATLDGWLTDVQAPAAVGIDFGDDWHPDGGHALYLFAPAEAPRPTLQLAELLPIVADRGLTYQCSGFFATHRCSANILLEFLNDQETVIKETLLSVEPCNDRPGGRNLADYRWRQWSLTPPATATRVRLSLNLGAHTGAGEATSFLFVSQLFMGVIDPQAPLAWAPYSPGARALSEELTRSHWQAGALIDVDTLDPAAHWCTEVEVASETACAQIKLEATPDRALDDESAVVELIATQPGGLRWIGTHWPLVVRIRVTTEQGEFRVDPGPAYTAADFLRVMLAGENLLPNSAFDQGFDHWERHEGQGLDFSPGTRLTDGHVAYLHRQATEENGPLRLYTEPVRLPAGFQDCHYQVSGYLAYHRCTASLGVEWLDEHGAVIDQFQWPPSYGEATGGTDLADYDHQGGSVAAPEQAVAARLFVEKSQTRLGHNDSFLFFTRLFFSLAGPVVTPWKPMDGAYLERLNECVASAEYFQPLLQEHLEQAEAASRAGHWSLAVAHWRSILAVDMAGALGVRATVRLAEALRRQGALTEAESTLSAGVERFPESRELLIAAAELATVRQDWAAASARWGQVLDLGGGELPTRFYLQYSMALCRQQRNAEAEQLIAARLAQDPQDPLLIIAQAEIAMAQQNWPEAIKHWREIAA